MRHARAVTRWLERSVAFRSWGSVASSAFVTLLGGVHLILANPPWRQLQERAEKIPGDKKHVEGILSQSPCVAQFNTAQNRPGPFVSPIRVIIAPLAANQFPAKIRKTVHNRT